MPNNNEPISNEDLLNAIRGLYNDEPNRVQLTGSIIEHLLEERSSSMGREVLSGTQWTSEVFDVSDSNEILLSTALNLNSSFEIRLIWCVSTGSEIAGGTFITKIIENGSTTEFGRTSILSPKMKIQVRNTGENNFRIGLIVYKRKG